MAQDFMPRSFQADLDRFFRRIVGPTLEEFSPHMDVKEGKVVSEAEFFDSAEKHTFNHVAYEARRAFALALDGIFERQLREWARVHSPDADKAKLEKVKFDLLLIQMVELHHLDLETRSIGDSIRELHLLANVVRHGEGPSLEKLQRCAPHLWASPTEQGAEQMQISNRRFIHYICALTRFWGLADREPFAITDAPYCSEAA